MKSIDSPWWQQAYNVPARVTPCGRIQFPVKGMKLHYQIRSNEQFILTWFQQSYSWTSKYCHFNLNIAGVYNNMKLPHFKIKIHWQLERLTKKHQSLKRCMYFQVQQCLTRRHSYLVLSSRATSLFRKEIAGLQHVMPSEKRQHQITDI